MINQNASGMAIIGCQGRTRPKNNNNNNNIRLIVKSTVVSVYKNVI
jgi:hypothetical protein